MGWTWYMYSVSGAQPTSSIKKWHFLRFALAFPTFVRKSQRAKLLRRNTTINTFSPSILSLSLFRWSDESRCMQWEMWRKNEDQIKSWKKCEHQALTAWRSGNKQQQFCTARTRNANARVYKLGSCLCPREFYVFSFSRRIFGGVDDNTFCACVLGARACTEKPWTTTQMLHI